MIPDIDEKAIESFCAQALNARVGGKRMGDIFGATGNAVKRTLALAEMIEGRGLTSTEMMIEVSDDMNENEKEKEDEIRALMIEEKRMKAPKQDQPGYHIFENMIGKAAEGIRKNFEEIKRYKAEQWLMWASVVGTGSIEGAKSVLDGTIRGNNIFLVGLLAASLVYARPLGFKMIETNYRALNKQAIQRDVIQQGLYLDGKDPAQKKYIGQREYLRSFDQEADAYVPIGFDLTYVREGQEILGQSGWETTEEAGYLVKAKDGTDLPGVFVPAREFRGKEGLTPELEQKFTVTALKIEDPGGAYYIGKDGDFQYAREGEWLVRDRVGKMQTIPDERFTESFEKRAKERQVAGRRL